MQQIGANDAWAYQGSETGLSSRLHEIDGDPNSDLIASWSAETGATRSACLDALMDAGYRLYQHSIWVTDLADWPGGRGDALVRLSVQLHDVIGDTSAPIDMPGAHLNIVEQLELEDDEDATVGDIVWGMCREYASGEEARIVVAWGWKLIHVRHLGRAIADTGDCVAAIADALHDALVAKTQS